MYQTLRPRNRAVAIFALTAALAGAFGSGSAAVASDDACVYYEHDHGRAIVVDANDPRCPVTAAAIEAAGWPDYDSTAISDSERNIAIDAATREAAAWPDYDSTAISNGESTDVASDGPRMTQIAAEEASSDTDVARANPFVL